MGSSGPEPLPCPWPDSGCGKWANQTHAPVLLYGTPWRTLGPNLLPNDHTAPPPPTWGCVISGGSWGGPRCGHLPRPDVRHHRGVGGPPLPAAALPLRHGHVRRPHPGPRAAPPFRWASPPPPKENSQVAPRDAWECVRFETGGWWRSGPPHPPPDVGVPGPPLRGGFQNNEKIAPAGALHFFCVLVFPKSLAGIPAL